MARSEPAPATTSPSSRDRVPRPQAKSSSGSAPARASWAARPTLVSRAEETTHGSPAAPATRNERRTPPSGVHLITATSAAPATATRSGSSARRIDSSAARLLDVLQSARCLVEQADVGDSGVDVPDAVGVHPDRPAGAERVADGFDAGEVFGQRLGVVGDLDLGGAAARLGGDLVGPFGADDRHGAVDRDAIPHRF